MYTVSMNTNSETLNKELAKLAKSSEWQKRLKARRWLDASQDMGKMPKYVAKYIISVVA